MKRIARRAYTILLMAKEKDILKGLRSQLSLSLSLFMLNE